MRTDEEDEPLGMRSCSCGCSTPANEMDRTVRQETLVGKSIEGIHDIHSLVYMRLHLEVLTETLYSPRTRRVRPVP